MPTGEGENAGGLPASEDDAAREAGDPATATTEIVADQSSASPRAWHAEDTPPTQVSEELAGATAEPAPLPRGTSVGRYLVLDTLGRGGMGIVYEAHDPDLNRHVALKLVRIRAHRSEHRARRTRERLLREAQALARVADPNVIGIYDVGIIDHDVFLAMELVTGASLRAWLRASPRPWREALAVMRQAGAGLAAAHRAGLIHRDFKPENVVVGDDGRVRVLDFGLARPSDYEPTPGPADPLASTSADLLASPMTHAGAIMGTPAYMAPEQWDGEVDARSDQFSFCVAAWEALYGTHPFGGPDRETRRQRAAEGALRSPPRRARVPARVHRALARGLAADPDARHPSMDALLAALARDPAVRRRRIGAAAVAIAGVLGAATVMVRAGASRQPCTGGRAAIADAWDDRIAAEVQAAFARTGHPFAAQLFERTSDALGDYADDWVTMHTEACRATRVHGTQSDALLDRRMLCLARRHDALAALTGDLTRATDRAVIEAAVEATYALPEIIDCADVEALTSASWDVDSPAARALSKDLARAASLRRLGQLREARAAARPVLSRARAEQLRGLEAEASHLLAELDHELGDVEDAEEASYRTARVAARAHRDDLVAESLLDVVWYHAYERHDYARAAVAARTAELAVARAGDPPALRAHYEHIMGVYHYLQRDHVQARTHYETALALRREIFGEAHPAVASTINNLAALNQRVGEHQRAVDLFREALAIREQLLGRDHPAVARALTNLAGAEIAGGRRDRARPLLVRARAIQERVHGPDSTRLGATLTALGDVERLDGNLAEARALAERKLAITLAARGGDSPILVPDLLDLGRIARLAGDLDGARAHFERAAQIAETVYGADDLNTCLVWLTVGELELTARRFPEALRWFGRCHQLALTVRGPQDSHAVSARVGMGRAQVGMGRLLEGRATLGEALAHTGEREDLAVDAARARLAAADAEWRLGQRELGRALARQALAALEARGDEYPEDLRAARRWLAAH